MSNDATARAAEMCSQLAEDLHRRARIEAQRPPLRSGRPELDAALDKVQEGSRELSERSVEMAASWAATFTAKIFEEGTA